MSKKEKDEYEAFGSVLKQNCTKVFTASFTGKIYDVEAGMYYFNVRWHDSEMGRFVTEAPARDGIDWYDYCNNNPVKFLAPTGMYTSEEQIEVMLSPSDKQMEFLKSEYNSVRDASNEIRGAKAAEMRELRSLMDLGGLFEIDSDFMDSDLRSFFNLKEDGTMNYSYDELKNGEKNGLILEVLNTKELPQMVNIIVNLQIKMGEK